MKLQSGDKDCKEGETASPAPSKGCKIHLPAPLKLTNMLYLVCLIGTTINVKNDKLWYTEDFVPDSILIKCSDFLVSPLDSRKSLEVASGINLRI